MTYTTQELKELKDIKKIFFVGIKGVGMCPMAIIAYEAGIQVMGSDVSEAYITDSALEKAGIEIVTSFDEKEVESFFEGNGKDECLLITTGAHKGFDNPQAAWAKENGYCVLSQGQALASFMEGDIFERVFRNIAVSGSHGKTTISSLLSSTLIDMGQDPTYSVGTGELFPIGSPGHFGHGKIFVAEADEYVSEPHYDRVPKFLYLSPTLAIINNIDFDHPDVFSSIDDVKRSFVEFANNIKSGGILFANIDDRNVQDILPEITKDIRVVKYGTLPDADYSISKIVQFGMSSKFTVSKKGVEIGVFDLSIPGVHNAKNSLSVIALLLELGFDKNDIKKSLSKFTGTKRRLERVGTTSNGAIIIDDYAHHPLEISTTVDAVRASYPDKKLVCVFQHHTFSRTKALLSEFSSSFKRVDELVLLPVFKSQRDSEKDTITIEEIADAHSKNAKTVVLKNFDDVVEYLRKNANSPEFVILFLGAGDIYKAAYKLK